MSKMLLKEYRLKAGLLQREVADKLNVTQSNYHKLESGKSNPNSIQIIILCQLFSCTPNDLFGFFGDYKTILDRIDSA